MELIDREDHQKLYLQLFAILKKKIESSEWSVGSQIPTEEELCKLFNVSRATVRTAVLELVRQGYLKRQHLDVEKSRRDEKRPIPQGFPYERIPGLSREMVQRFGEVEPQTLGQANRIPGVTPAAVALVGAYLKRFTNDATGVQRPADETGA